VSFREERIQVLIKLGVKDSKLLSPKKRESLALGINREEESHHIVKIAPKEIDKAVESGRKLHKLNRLEAKTMTQVIDALRPDIAYVDAADVLEDRFKQHIQEDLSFRVRIISKHKADKTYPVVSAASILAKVERDRVIADLRCEYGDFGSGYLADPKTLFFLRSWLKCNHDYPDCVRKSWKPAKKIKLGIDVVQKKLA
jgi:ribonuclease HII